eukprot:gene10698-7431_t
MTRAEFGFRRCIIYFDFFPSPCLCLILFPHPNECPGVVGRLLLPECEVGEIAVRFSWLSDTRDPEIAGYGRSFPNTSCSAPLHGTPVATPRDTSLMEPVATRYAEEEVIKAREALAQRGYPNPTAADIEHVLQYVHQEEQGGPPQPSSSNSEPAAAKTVNETESAGVSRASLSAQQQRHSLRRSAGSSTVGSVHMEGGAASRSATGRTHTTGSTSPTQYLRRSATQDDDMVERRSPASNAEFGSNRNVTLTAPEDDRIAGRYNERRSQRSSGSRNRCLPSSAHGSKPSSARPRPMWNDSTIVMQSSSPVNGPHFPPSTEPKVQQMPNAGTSRYAGNQRANTAGSALWSPATHLPPSARLERYMKRFEKALTELYAEHPALAPEGSPYVDGAPHERSPRPRNPTGDSASDEEEDAEPGYPSKEFPRHSTSQGVPQMVLEMPLRPSRYFTVNGARRSANVVFDITGDPRYRFRPSCEPEIVQDSSRAPPTHGPPPRGSHPIQGKAPGGSARAWVPVSHFIDPTGSTLRRKADPVSRGEQMRTLWRRDTFLAKALPGTERWHRNTELQAFGSPRDTEGGGRQGLGNGILSGRIDAPPPPAPQPKGNARPPKEVKCCVAQDNNIFSTSLVTLFQGHRGGSRAMVLRMPCPFAYAAKFFVAIFIGAKCVQLFLYNRLRINGRKKDDENTKTNEESASPDTKHCDATHKPPQETAPLPPATVPASLEGSVTQKANSAATAAKKAASEKPLGNVPPSESVPPVPAPEQPAHEEPAPREKSVSRKADSTATSEMKEDASDSDHVTPSKPQQKDVKTPGKSGTNLDGTRVLCVLTLLDS